MRTYLIIPILYLTLANLGLATPSRPVVDIAKDIGDIFEDIMRKVAERPDSPFMRRTVFGKDHGCLKAKFTVNPKLPKKYRVGPFEKEWYPAWIRFSNDGGYGPDSRKVNRGMTIKLVGVKGKKLLPGEENAVTQDFLMENHPTFFVNTAEEFLESTRVALSEDPEDDKRFDAEHPHQPRILAEMRANILSDPLDGIYWTPTPYKFLGKPIKYKAEPCGKIPDPLSKPRANRDFLRENLVAHLKESAAAQDRGEKGKEVCFHFYIQFQTNEEDEPVELPTKPWTGKFRHMGTFDIDPHQNIDAEERKWACESLSFTGWHTADLEPLGTINEARKYVYKRTADIRRKENDKKVKPVPLEEPTELDLGTP